jgi:hypothetical protein
MCNFLKCVNNCFTFFFWQNYNSYPCNPTQYLYTGIDKIYTISTPAIAGLNTSALKLPPDTFGQLFLFVEQKNIYICIFIINEYNITY